MKMGNAALKLRLKIGSKDHNRIILEAKGHRISALESARVLGLMLYASGPWPQETLRV